MSSGSLQALQSELLLPFSSKRRERAVTHEIQWMGKTRNPARTIYNIHSDHQLQRSIPKEILSYANRKQLENKAKLR